MQEVDAVSMLGGTMSSVLRRVLGAGVAVVAVVAGFAMPADAARPHREPATRILIVGDSVTHGSVGDWTWRYRLWKNLAASGERVDFVGPHSGLMNHETGDREDMGYADPNFDDDHASRWGMGFLSMEYSIGDLVREYQPDVVIEMLGTNDLLWYGRTQDDVAVSVSEFVREAREAKPDVSVVLGHVPDPWVGGADGVNWWLDVIADDRDVPGARVVASEPPASWVQGEDTYDSLHPSAQGEVKIAESMATALAEIGIGSRPHAFPSVVNGPVDAPRLRAWPDWRGQPKLSWSLPLGAEGVNLWRRDLTAGTGWEQVDASGLREPLVPGQLVQWRVQAFKGSAVSPLFSNAVTVRLGQGIAKTPRPPKWRTGR